MEKSLQKVLQKHTEELKQQESHKHVLEIIKIKQEHATKEKMPKYSTNPFDQTAKNEYKQKDILFKIMMASKSYNKHPTHKVLYDALIESLFVDEDDMDIAAKKRQRIKDVEPLKKSSTSKETAKGKTPSKNSKIEPIFDDVANNADEPQGDDVIQTPKFEWFKQPLRPETPDPD
ncbi:hypothetical protein Tco_0171230 [Tanacetum coccineum]